MAEAAVSEHAVAMASEVAVVAELAEAMVAMASEVAVASEAAVV